MILIHLWFLGGGINCVWGSQSRKSSVYWSPPYWLEMGSLNELETHLDQTGWQGACSIWQAPPQCWDMNTHACRASTFHFWSLFLDPAPCWNPGVLCHSQSLEHTWYWYPWLSDHRSVLNFGVEVFTWGSIWETCNLKMSLFLSHCHLPQN